MIFKPGYRITQEFGANADYYKQFGIPHHEGIDLVSMSDDWEIYSFPYAGRVVKDIDSPRGVYGNNVTIWYPDIGLAFQYCHMKINRVSVGDVLKPMQLIGTMGDTGNSMGAHVHLNGIAVDKNGYRQKHFGINGCFDFLPALVVMAGPPVNVSGNPWYSYLSDHPELRGIRGED